MINVIGWRPSPASCSISLVRLARVAVGFAQQAFGFVNVALTRRVQRFKAQAAGLPGVDDNFHYGFF